MSFAYADMDPSMPSPWSLPKVPRTLSTPGYPGYPGLSQMTMGFPAPALPGDASPFHPPVLLGRSLSHAMTASPMIPQIPHAPSSPSGLVHSTSHLLNFQSLMPSASHSQTSMFQPANFQFTFNAEPSTSEARQPAEPVAAPQADLALGGTSASSASAAPWDSHAQAAPSQSSVHRREAQRPAAGVCQEPMNCDAQLKQCIAECRRVLEAKAAQCRSAGKKYFDPDFPSDSRSLWLNGLSPSEPLSSVTVSSWSRSKPQGEQPQVGYQGADVIAPGALGSFHLQGALAMMRSVGKDPNELIVHRDADVGIYGVRFFKDGRWIYEVLDDLLPESEQRQLSSSCNGQEWPALIEKAYAKLHGCYEAVATGAEEDAMEDLLGAGSGRFAVSDFPVWAELWQHLRSKRKRGFALAAIRRREAAGEVLTSGLLSGCAYPIIALEVVNGHALVALENPWFQGRWNGHWGPDSPGRRAQLQLPGCQPFWMSIQDFCQHFTDIAQARLVPGSWQAAMVAMSEERPSYPLVSVSSPTQAIFLLSQADPPRGSQRSAVPLGLRVYRCRIVAPPQHATGVKQNVSNPFKPLELVAEMPISQSGRSVMVEVPKLEPNCLYVASIIYSPNAPPDLAILRVLTASSMRFRELSVPESAYFLQAEEQVGGRPLYAIDTDSFSSQGSLEAAQLPTPARNDPMRDSASRGVDGAASESWQTSAASAASDTWQEVDLGFGEFKLPPFLQEILNQCSGVDC